MEDKEILDSIKSKARAIVIIALLMSKFQITNQDFTETLKILTTKTERENYV